MSGLPVARKGDRCTGHGSHHPRPSTQGSPDTFANSKPVHRKGDSWGPHSHTSNLAKGSTTVFANSKQVGRKTDPVVCKSKVAQGSPDVFAG
jgi:uncharacterized Zn-binding protein involved in type VI secretion